MDPRFQIAKYLGGWAVPDAQPVDASEFQNKLEELFPPVAVPKGKQPRTCAC